MPLDLAANPQLRTILAELRRRFEDLYGDRLVKMVLYGSQARGDARRSSDIDVMVVLKGPVVPSQEIHRTGGIVSEVCLEFDAVVQCHFVDQKRFEHSDDFLMENVQRDGVEL